MKIQKARLEGEEVTVYTLERMEDLGEFWKWFDRQGVLIGADIESSTKTPYAENFRIKLVQFGDAYTGWVFDPELFIEPIRKILESDHRFVFHNGMGFDVPALHHKGFCDATGFAVKVIDTQILAHLIDPRPKEHGGIGLKLKELANHYVDPEASDGQEELHKVFREDLKVTIKSGEGWAKIPADHPVYTLYAGLDPILAYRLCSKLTPIIRGNNISELAQKEHYVARIIMGEHLRGMLIDEEYIRTDLIPYFEREQEKWGKIAKRYGVDNPNSNVQIIAALQGMGEQWTAETQGGQPSVGGEVLRGMADLDKGWERVNYREPNPLAEAVIKAKRAGKWLQAYAYGMLNVMDSNGRVHPNIRTLGARTGRMSVSNPPLQQLPKGDKRVRRSIIADPGYLIIGADYAQVEMRVMAALAGVPGMKDAIREGQSLHVYTADMIWPEGWDKNSWQYTGAKNTGFCKVFGGGVNKIAETAGIPYEQAKFINDAYERAFPEIRRYSQLLQNRARQGRLEVITPFGRHLPLDRKRLYSAVNYMVQSSARDIMLDGRIRIHEAGLDEYILLEIHDEILGQAPAAEAEDIVRTYGKIMETTFLDVPITSDPDVYGRSWAG